MQTYHPALPSARSSSQGGQPAQGRSRTRGKALVPPLPSGRCRPESSPSNTKPQGKHSRGICFPSAEHSNFPEQPREREKRSQQTNAVDWAEPLTAGRVHQSPCRTTYFRCAWTLSLGKKKEFYLPSALICVAKKGTKSIRNALKNWQIVSYVVCEFLSPRTVKSLWTSAEVMKGRWGGVGRASTRWLACVQDYKRTSSCEHFKFTWGLHQIQHAQGCSFLTSFLWPGRQKSPSSSASPTFPPLRGKRNTILHLLLMQTSQQTTYSTGKLLPPFTTSWKHAGDILLFLDFEQKSRAANNPAKTSTNVHTTCTVRKTRL